MRPLASFTVHAILAAAIAALATASAAAEEEVYFKITLQDTSGAATDQSRRLEVHSYYWGTPSSAIKLEPVRITSYQLGGSNGDSASAMKADPGRRDKRAAGGKPPQDLGTGHNEMSLDDTAGKEKSASTGGQVATGSHTGAGQPAGRITGIAGDPADPASSQATGKRQHKPVLTRGHYDQSEPPERGILTVLTGGSFCNVGSRHPSLALSGRGKTFLLYDVKIAACNDAPGGGKEIGFAYGKVQIRGWNPKSKEQ